MKSKEEALKALRDLKQKDFWLAEVLGGSGYSLALAGRLGDANKRLDEALDAAKELQNQGLTSQTLRFQATRLALAGDHAGASRLADQAVQAASRAPDRTLDLWARAAAAATGCPM